MSISLILGCFGLKENEFISCLGIENKIFEFNSKHPNYSEIMDFFDQYQLFDKAILDYNGIRNFLLLFRESFDQITNRVWSENLHNLIGKFTISHKSCGLYLKLSSNFQQKQIEEKAIMIESNAEYQNKIQTIMKMRGNNARIK